MAESRVNYVQFNMKGHSQHSRVLIIFCHLTYSEAPVKFISDQTTVLICNSSSFVSHNDSYLSLDYVHEARHELRTLQQKVKVVEDDFRIPANNG